MLLFELPPPVLISTSIIKADPSKGYSAMRRQGMSPQAAAKEIVKTCCNTDIGGAVLWEQFENDGRADYFKGMYFGKRVEFFLLYPGDEVQMIDHKRTVLDIWDHDNPDHVAASRKLKAAMVKVFFEIGEFHYQKKVSSTLNP